MWLLKGGWLCCPATGRSGQADLRVHDGRITEIGPDLEARGEQVLDCAGLTVIPALVDLACELGVSPNTAPVIDQASAVQDVLSRAMALTGARVRVAGALTAQLAGRELAELNDLVDAGAVALSDGARGMGDALVLRNALDYARLTGCAVHLSHVTTARGVELLRQARAEGLPVTSAVPARHLLLTDQEIDDREYNSNLRLLPPLRPESDRAALVAAVREGVIDVVSADHVPWTRVEKEQEFMLANPGALGLESAFSAAMTALGDLALVVMAMAVRPAERIGQRAALELGAVADLAIVDPDASAPLGPPQHSRGMNEPLQGRVLRGQVHGTLVNGRVAWAKRTLVIR